MKTKGFELPPEFKAFAEQGIETARRAFKGYLDATQKAFGAAAASSQAAQSGAGDISRKAAGFAQQNLTETFAFIEKLMRAKDAEEVMQLQSDFAKAQIERLAEQTKSLGELAAKVTQRD